MIEQGGDLGSFWGWIENHSMKLIQVVDSEIKLHYVCWAGFLFLRITMVGPSDLQPWR